MRIAISEKIRKEVADRANHKCEYCQIHMDDMFLSFELDHILPIKHGGSSEIENLALACPHCNQHKGSDFATIVNAEVVRLFNPRIDNWQENFRVVNGAILSKSKIGEASIKIFRFNEPDRVILRQLLTSIGRY
ncbi:MAG: HNH endonuclease [Bacteroidota bacterium]|jgi:hypothetical protein|nr:HNH endonuclease [Cytophagales bacterium]MCE2958423.1 HNH endonuclease [Flammeovirgaceae bacterium]MCZ8071654.1 HNH endonuclease [Cytophagales bacterium]